MKIVTTLNKNPYVIAAWRTAETFILVALLTYFTSLLGVLQTPGGWATYDWRQALVALGMGVAAGIIKGAITLINLYQQKSSAKGSTS